VRRVVRHDQCPDFVQPIPWTAQGSWAELQLETIGCTLPHRHRHYPSVVHTHGVLFILSSTTLISAYSLIDRNGKKLLPYDARPIDLKSAIAILTCHGWFRYD
jgi:hypothetical protein